MSLGLLKRLDTLNNIYDKQIYDDNDKPRMSRRLTRDSIKQRTSAVKLDNNFDYNAVTNSLDILDRLSEVDV